MHEDILKLADIPAEAAKPLSHMETLVKTLHEAPAAAARMRQHGIPEQIIADTFADIGHWARYCKRVNGYWGIPDGSFEWFPNHLGCKIFRIGRFQCIPKPFPARFNARFFRNNKTGKLLALTAGDIEFRADGQVSGTGEIYADENGFRGFFREENGTAIGIVLDPAGFARNETATLCLNEWTEVLKEGMPVFELHIPAEGGLDMDACRASLTAMVEFAKTHENAIAELTGTKGPFVAFTLASWLLDAQLDGIMPPTSRLVQHLRQYYLLPDLAKGYNYTYRIFDGRQIDINNISPEEIKTSLQRNMVDFMRRGGRTRHNVGIVMFDDVFKFGTEMYRRTT